MARARLSVIASLALVFALVFQYFSANAQDNGETQAVPQDPAAASPPQAPTQSDYLGSQVCEACHEDLYNSWEKTPHWKTTLDTKGGPSHQGCEGCHGPGRRTWPAAATSRKYSLSEVIDQGDQRSLPDLPCCWHPAYERHQFRAHEK